MERGEDTKMRVVVEGVHMERYRRGDRYEGNAAGLHHPEQLARGDKRVLKMFKHRIGNCKLEEIVCERQPVQIT